MASTSEAPSLESILSHHGVQNELLDSQCSNKVRIKISEKLNDWKYLCRVGFGFEAYEVTSISHDNDTLSSQKIAFLDTWARKHGKDASYLKLAQGLYSGGRRDLVDYLCVMLNDQVENATRVNAPPGGPAASSGMQ